VPNFVSFATAIAELTHGEKSSTQSLTQSINHSLTQSLTQLIFDAPETEACALEEPKSRRKVGQIFVKMSYRLQIETILYIQHCVKVSIRSRLFPGRRSERKFWWKSKIRRKRWRSSK